MCITPTGLKNGSDTYCDVTHKPKQKIFYCSSITFWWDTLYNTFKINDERFVDDVIYRRITQKTR